MTHLFYGLSHPENKPELIKNKIIHRVFLVSLLALIPLLVIVYLRYLKIGGSPAIIFADFFVLLILIAFSFSKKLSIKLKTIIYLCLLLMLSLSGIYNFGYFASVRYVFLLIAVLGVTYLNSKWSIIYFTVTLVSYVVIAWSYISGLKGYNFDTNSLLNSSEVWIIEGVTLFSITIVIGIIVGSIFDGYKKEVQNLRRSEHVLYQTIQRLPLSTLIINRNLDVIYINTTFMERTGLDSCEGLSAFDIIKKLYPSENMVDKGVVELLPKIQDAFDTKVFPPVIEVYFYTLKGEKKWSEIHYNLADDDMALIMFVDITDKKLKQKEVIEAMVNAEENEKSRMAKELHDGIGPLVSTAKIYAHSLKTIQDEKKRMEHANRLLEILDETMHEVRTMSNSISPHILRNYGLKEAIQSFIDKLIPVTKIKFEIEFDDSIELTQTFQFTVYRTLVEMVNNSIKYADAKTISIIFKKYDEMIEVSYSDDGVGFEMKEKLGEGFGLLNMQSRIESLGASYHFYTSPGNGVKVSIKIQSNDSKNSAS